MKSYLNLKTTSFLAIFCCLIAGNMYAQVGINTTNPRGQLDIVNPAGTTAGVVLPVVSLTASNVQSPITNPHPSQSAILDGTVVYNTNTTNTGNNDVVPGMYVWDGSNWIPQFQRRQHYLDESSLGFRTRSRSSGGVRYTEIIANTTFTADYTGNYIIKIRGNFGGGGAEVPNGGSEGYLNVARQRGYFELTWNGVNEQLYGTTYSTAYDGSVGATNYFAIWQEFAAQKLVNLTAGASITYRLRWAQYLAPEFVGNASGSTSSGRGYVAYDIPCTVEIIYVGE